MSAKLHSMKSFSFVSRVPRSLPFPHSFCITLNDLDLFCIFSWPPRDAGAWTPILGLAVTPCLFICYFCLFDFFSFAALFISEHFFAHLTPKTLKMAVAHHLCQFLRKNETIDFSTLLSHSPREEATSNINKVRTNRGKNVKKKRFFSIFSFVEQHGKSEYYYCV